MKIDISIIEQYLQGKPIDNIRKHWIFNSIIPGEIIFEEPKKENVSRIKEVFETLLKSLDDFKPINLLIWEEFFGKFKLSFIDTTVYLIVGSPSPYDAMVREDKNGNNCIILDVERIRAYSDDIEEITNIINKFITHEMAHIYIGEKYKYPDVNNSFDDVLKHIVFDEGIAHFLSFDKDVLSIDWYEEEMLKRREKAFSTLIYHLDNNCHGNKELLMKANCGKFWDKFGAISGLFAIIDYFNSKDKRIECFREIIDNGPNLLIDVIKNNDKLSR